MSKAQNKLAKRLINRGGVPAAKQALAALREAGMSDSDVRDAWLDIGVHEHIVDEVLPE